MDVKNYLDECRAYYIDHNSDLSVQDHNEIEIMISKPGLWDNLGELTADILKYMLLDKKERKKLKVTRVKRHWLQYYSLVFLEEVFSNIYALGYISGTIDETFPSLLYHLARAAIELRCSNPFWWN